MTERLTVVSGSMFSGKTDELIRLIGRAEHGAKKVQVFKPMVDDRWGAKNTIKSHSGAEHDATPVGSSLDILENLKEKLDVVFVDEIQFFDKQVVDVVEELLNRDIEVVVAGLPLDFRGEEFGEMPALLARADDISRLTAICKCPEDDGDHTCGEEATRTQRFIDGNPSSYYDPVVQIGGKESYAARCPDHHYVPDRPPKNLIRKEEQE